MPDLGRILVILGIVLLVVGDLFILLPRLGLPLGRLPGDLRLKLVGSPVLSRLHQCGFVHLVDDRFELAGSFL